LGVRPRSRQGHSPTFRWKGSDLGRLIKLVTDCSESPHFEAQSAAELAAELVQKQDEEREQMKRLAAQFAKSFAGIDSVSKLLQPQLGQWAVQQNKLFQNLSRSFVAPAISKQIAGIVTPSLHEQMRGLGLTESVRKAMLPTLAPGFTSSLVAGALPRQSLLAQRVLLPNTFYNGFSKSLQQSLAFYRTPTVLPALEALTRTQTVTIGQIVKAAHEAAALAEREGARSAARDLADAATEAVALVEAPSPEKLEQQLAELSRQINEQFNELRAAQGEADKKQQRWNAINLAINVLLCILQISISLYGLPFQHHAPPALPPQKPQPPTQSV
jgi:hypothetical protein